MARRLPRFSGDVVAATIRTVARIAALLLIVGWLPARADDLNGRRLVFGGFGTLAMDYQTTSGLEYRRGAAQPDGAKGGQIDFANDSLAGAQVNAAWNRQLEAVVQVVAKHYAGRDWQPQFTRAFLRYVPDESIMLRGGRIGYEFFPRADSSDIGYTALPLRPPPEMFGQLPDDDFDGGDVTLTYPLGPGLVRAKAFGGVTGGTMAFSDGSRSDTGGTSVWGAHLEYLRGPWLAHLGAGWYLIGHSLTPTAVIDALRQTGQPQAQHLAGEFERIGRSTAIYTVALTYDDGPWQGRLYLVRTVVAGSIGPKLNIGVFSLGYRIRQLTPYGLLSGAYNYAKLQSTGLPDSPQTAALNAGADAVQTQSQTNQATAALGLRYDFAPKMDLKLQVDHVWTHRSMLVFDSDTPPRNRAQLTVIGLAFDFVF